VNNSLPSTAERFIREYVLTSPELPADVAEWDAIRAVHTPEQTEFAEKMLNGSQAKTAFAIRHNAEEMIKEAGIECVVFLTLTAGDWVKDRGSEEGHFEKIYDSNEANRRFNNLNRRVLPDIFERAIVVTERFKDGGIHYHLLGVLRGRPDVRTGFDFYEVERKNYRSVSRRLQAVWALLRRILPEYGFGRHEALPIKKTGQAVASYVSKYIEKNVCNRLKDDKGKRLVRYLGWNGSQLKPNGFGWASQRATAWRCKTRELFRLVGITEPEQAAQAIGPRWAWHASQTWGRVGLADVYPGLCCGYAEKRVLSREIIRLNERWFVWKEGEGARDRAFIDQLELDDPNYWGRLCPDTIQTANFNPLETSNLQNN
jgi:hypothetical protein